MMPPCPQKITMDASGSSQVNVNPFICSSSSFLFFSLRKKYYLPCVQQGNEPTVKCSGPWVGPLASLKTSSKTTGQLRLHTSTKQTKRQMGDQKGGQNHDGLEAKKKVRTKRKGRK